MLAKQEWGGEVIPSFDLHWEVVVSLLRGWFIERIELNIPVDL